MSEYDQDFYGWTQRTAELLRTHRFKEVDWEHLIDEIETLGRSEKRELKNRLAVLLTHLLKWKYQPQRRGASWQNTIEVQRLDARDVLADNPSLKPQLADLLAQAYQRARLAAARQTRLPLETFSQDCPFTLEQALNSEYWPE